MLYTTTIVCIELAIFSSHILGLIIISPLIIWGLEQAMVAAAAAEKKEKFFKSSAEVLKSELHPFFNHCSSWNQYPNQVYLTFTQFPRFPLPHDFSYPNFKTSSV